MTAPTFTQRCAAIHAAGDRVRRDDGVIVGRVVALLFDHAGEAALVVWPSTLVAQRVALDHLEPAPWAVAGRGPAS
jgi:hypothetical protein